MSDRVLVKVTVEFPNASQMMDFVMVHLFQYFERDINTLTMSDLFGAVLTWETLTDDSDAYYLDMWENAQLVTWNKAHFKFGYNDAEHIAGAENL